MSGLKNVSQKPTGKTRSKDASTDVRVNPVELPDGRVVSWAEAFPRPEHGRKS